MENKDTIRRAMALSAQPELPAGFTARLMERMARRDRRRETVATVAYTAAGIACFAALAVAGAGALNEYAGAGAHRPALAEHNPFATLHLPSLPMPDSEQLPQIEAWGFIGVVSIVLLLGDITIRRMLTRRVHGARK